MDLGVRVFAWLCMASVSSLWAAGGSVSGQLTDPQGKPVGGAKLRLASARSSSPLESASDPGGGFAFPSLAEGTYQLSAATSEFAEVKKTIRVDGAGTLTVDLQFFRLAP